jgi:hypothetical protein
MREPPWLQEPALGVVALLLKSHRAAFGTGLVAGVDAIGANPRLAAQELFAADQVVLAHDGSADPQLIYANAAALSLWKRRWGEMVGMPSRLTAEPEERQARAEALARARWQESLRGYRGIRVDRAGSRFWIDGARLWTLRDRQGVDRGQAACFSSWWQL